MAEIVHKERIVGGYEYKQCPTCKTEIEIRHPSEMHMPYCSDCGRIVLDAEQKYCCWCGMKFN